MGKKKSMLVSWRVLLLHEKYALLTVMALATLFTLSAQCGSGEAVAKFILHVGTSEAARQCYLLRLKIMFGWVSCFAIT